MAQQDSATFGEIRTKLAAMAPRIRADLESLVRIPSINFPSFDRAPVLECADACATLLRDAGAPAVQLIPGDSGVPTVRADIPGPPNSPTVLLYAHYDVQPIGNSAKWTSSAFEPKEIGGRLHGRGAADDKSGVVSHVAMLRAFDGKPPVNLRILLEGEEEWGGDFEDWPTTRPDAFADVDVAIIADMGNVSVGKPTFTTQLRGLVTGTVTIRTLAEARHNGEFGGPAPDALMALMRLLATLQDDEGNCTIAGIPGREWDGADLAEDVFRDLAGLPPEIPLIGTGTLASRLFSKPAVNVTGIDAHSVAGAPNVLIPKARARICLRIPAAVSAPDANAALAAHIERNAPWGLSAVFEPDGISNGSILPTGGPGFRAYEQAMLAAYGVAPTQQGAGGSVPLVGNLIENYPDMEVLGVGAQDNAARIHSPNESVDLAELSKSILAQTLFVKEYADSNAATR